MDEKINYYEERKKDLEQQFEELLKRSFARLVKEFDEWRIESAKMQEKYQQFITRQTELKKEKEVKPSSKE